MADGLRVAADIGGTFTDLAFIARDGLVATRKVPSTPGNYADAVIRGIDELMADLKLDKGRIAEVLHGCTVATNTIVEHKGAKTALITTRGFRDVLELRRIRVPRLYEPLYVKPQPLVPRRLRLEVQERVGPRGEVITPLDLASVKRAIARLKAEKVEAVAVCLLHSYANPDHERRIGEMLRKAHARLLHLAVGRCAAADARIRAHQHDGDQRLYRPAGGGLSALADGPALQGRPQGAAEGDAVVGRNPRRGRGGRPAGADRRMRSGCGRDRRGQARHGGRLRQPDQLRHGRHHRQVLDHRARAACCSPTNTRSAAASRHRAR